MMMSLRISFRSSKLVGSFPFILLRASGKGIGTLSGIGKDGEGMEDEAPSSKEGKEGTATSFPHLRVFCLPQG